MANVVRVTPMFGVKDIDLTTNFYEKILGFKVGIKTKEYAYLSKGCANIRLEKKEGCPENGVSCVIDIEGIDEFYNTLKPALDELPENRISELENKSYGIRGFNVIDPNNITVYFCEQIPEFNKEKWINEHQ